MSPSASPAFPLLSDSPSVDPSRSSELSPPKRDAKPDRSFSDVMNRATATKVAPKGSSNDAPISTGADHKNPPRPSAPFKSIAPTRSVEHARTEHPATAPERSSEPRASSTQTSEADTANTDGEMTIDSNSSPDEADDNESQASNITIVPLMATTTPPLPVVPVPALVVLTGAEGSQPGTTENNVNTAATLTLPNSGASEAVPGAESSDHQSTDRKDDHGIDVRTLGLRPVSEREKAALELRAAISRLEAEEAGEPSKSEIENSDLASKIIPFPVPFGRESKIIPIQFRPVDDTNVSAATGETEHAAAAPQLPGSGRDTEKTAALAALFGTADSLNEEGSTGAKPHAKGPFQWGTDAGPPSVSDRGTSAARRERNMDSRSASANFDPIGDEGSLSDASRDATESPAPSLPNTQRLGSGVEWSSPAHWNTVSSVSSNSDAPSSVPVNTAGAVEKISKLINRETVLFRQHNSDSMAVVLRPDGNTELFLHLSRKDGQLEASVRCERGDFNQLNALWSQLQESLAQQKVRLIPLQESSGDPGTAFRQNSANGFDHAGRDQSSRQPHSDNDFMDEWPAPASREQQPAHVRSRGESGQRLSTSRPGWETWA